MKELTESPAVSAFRLRFEAGRSFDLDDDLEFCPGLLTEDDVSVSPAVASGSRFTLLLGADEQTLKLSSYNRYTPHRPTDHFQAALPTLLHSNIKSNQVNKSHQASLFLPRPTIPTTLRPVSRQITIITR